MWTFAELLAHTGRSLCVSLEVGFTLQRGPRTSQRTVWPRDVGNDYRCIRDAVRRFVAIQIQRRIIPIRTA